MVGTASRWGDIENVLALGPRVTGGASAGRRAFAFLLLCDQNVAEVWHGGRPRQA